MAEPFIVAELSGNHLGSLDLAMDILEAAAKAGADGFKLQTYLPADMVGDPDYIIERGKWKGKRLLSLYHQAHTPRSWHPILFNRAKKLGIEIFSAPFSLRDLDFLETVDCPRYKIASFELTDYELIAACARTGKPLIMSTGMASSAEIAKANSVAYLAGARDITLLKCTSSYPARPEDTNLLTLCDYKAIAKVGISDHTTGTAVAVAAVALGATVVEKHLCLDRKLGGPDAEFSLEPHEFKQLVTDCRIAHSALGKHHSYGGGETPELRRGLWAVRDIPAGHTITRADIKVARPVLGIGAEHLDRVVGTTTAKPISRNSPIGWDCLV